MLTRQTYKIRPSEMKDAPQLMEMDALVWDIHTSPAPFHWKSRQQFLQHCPPGSQLVAVQGERVCGYVGFYPPTGMPVNRHVYEINIAVHPNDRRSGVATSLMHAMKEYAREQGIHKLRLRVLSSNPGAIAFIPNVDLRRRGDWCRNFISPGSTWTIFS